MKAIPNALVVIIVTWLFGCSDRPQVKERGEFWNSSVQSFLIESRTIEELDDWLASNGAEPLKESKDLRDRLKAAKDPNFEPDFFYFSWLETIELNEIVCASWHFGLKVWADKDGTVLRHEIQSSGICL